VRDKLQLTQKLVQQLPAEHAISVDQARAIWWYNIRTGGGMRLTAAGFKALSELLGLEFYAYKIPDELAFTQQTVLDLDRQLQNPYYIVTKKNFPIDLIFFSSKEAMLINLYGSLDKFLDNYK